MHTAGKIEAKIHEAINKVAGKKAAHLCSGAL